MLTKEEINTCCANLASRFRALEKSRLQIAAAADKAIGNRLSALVENGLTRGNAPDPRNSLDARLFGRSRALEAAGCRCYFDYDEERKCLTMNFIDKDANIPSPYISQRFLTVWAMPCGCGGGNDEVYGYFPINGGAGNCTTFHASLRRDRLCLPAELMFPEELRRTIPNSNCVDIPLVRFIQTPKDVQALICADATLKAYQNRLCKIALLIEAASEILSALEDKFGATERERDERVRFIFGLTGESATPLATVYRVRLEPEPYAPAPTDAGGSDAE